MIIRVINDRLAWPIGLIDAGGTALSFGSGDLVRSDQTAPENGELDTRHRGGNHDPRKGTGTQRDANIG